MEEKASVLRKNMPTVIAGVIIALMLALSVAFAQAQQGGAAAGDGSRAPLAVLVHDGAGQTHELPLDVDGRYPIETELGSNVIVVEGGSVWIEEADCPNGDCLRQRPIDAPGPQLICLPHRLWVEIAPAGSDGGELDEASVSPAPEGIDVVAR